MNLQEKYMRRCLQLAALGNGNVAPNPLVGAVLVHDNIIIGEGFHEAFGGPHAEVNCINNVQEKDKHLIEKATLYVSLEPCAHFGKTPPCVDLIIQHKISKLVIACTDSFEKVNGKGIEKLQKAGVEMVLGILENEARELNKRFFIFNAQKRPYVILKWAQTADGFIGKENERLIITSEISNRLSHKWRSQEAAIMVGTNTALKDNPTLTNRLFIGKNPVRILLDKSLKITKEFNILNGESKTIILNAIENKIVGNLFYEQMDFTKPIAKQTCDILFKHHLQSVIIEGGSILLQTFINENIWDEARIFTNKNLFVHTGVQAPNIVGAKVSYELDRAGDELNIIYH